MTVGGLTALVLVFAAVTFGLTVYLQGELSWPRALWLVIKIYLGAILIMAITVGLALLLLNLNQPVF